MQPVIRLNIVAQRGPPVRASDKFVPENAALPLKLTPIPTIGNLTPTLPLPSGSICPTPTVTPILLRGDVGSDGVVNAVELNLILAYYRQQTPADKPSPDINGDGVIDPFDLTVVCGELNTSVQ